MNLRTKQWLIGVLGGVFLASLLFVQAMEVIRRREETNTRRGHVAIPTSSRKCVECHLQQSPGIVDHWTGSTHAAKGVGCLDCHKAEQADVDGWQHHGAHIATIVTPLDCSRCHRTEYQEFTASHHAKGGNILASLDNFLAETVEGSREPFNPHSPTPGHAVELVNGMASANTGCKQCHGAKVAIESTDGGQLTLDDFKPGADGLPTNKTAIGKIKRDTTGRPMLHPASWPNTGIGRLNLDGSRGSCSACHSRHDFSPRRARQPENCGKCHLGPDHPQKEVYEESKHGVAFRDLINHMNLDAPQWVLGKDYTQAPTCATCHMSGHSKNDGKVTHDPGTRISWTNRPPISLVMDTDADGEVVKEPDAAKRAELIKDTWDAKRTRMKQVCTHCHTENYVNAFYKQYDDFVINYNEKFAKPGKKIMDALKANKLITPNEFDEEIEWTWFYLWHHEGRRARHGASMMAPDYAHWHGMYEVAERFYQQLIPQAREIAAEAEHHGMPEAADAVRKVVDDILARPEHRWFESQLKTRFTPGGAEAAPPKAAEPAPDKPASEKPMPDKPAPDKPASEKPATEKPASEKPASEKPAAEKPAAEKPAQDNPSPAAKPNG